MKRRRRKGFFYWFDKGLTFWDNLGFWLFVAGIVMVAIGLGVFK